MSLTIRATARAAWRDLIGAATAAVVLASSEGATLAVLVWSTARPGRGLSFPAAAPLIGSVAILILLQVAARMALAVSTRRVQIRAAFAQMLQSLPTARLPAYVATSFVGLSASGEAATASAAAVVSSFIAALMMLTWAVAVAGLHPSPLGLATMIPVGFTAWLFFPREGARDEMRRWFCGGGAQLLATYDATSLQLIAIGADAALRKRLADRLGRERERLLARGRIEAAPQASLIAVLIVAISIWIVWRRSDAQAASLFMSAIAGARLGGLGAELFRSIRALMGEGAAAPTSTCAASSRALADRRGQAAAVVLTNVHLEGGHERGDVDLVDVVFSPGIVTTVIETRGSGAASLIDRLMGGDERGQGRTHIDGALLSEHDHSAWRAQVARVPARTLMIRGTLAANLRLAAPEATISSMWAALAAVGLSEAFRLHGQDLKLKLGSGAHRLTPADARRLSLARALLRSPRLLIIEEPSEALPAQDEVELDRVIMGLRERCTIVLSARSAWMLSAADEAILMEDGRLAEAGRVDLLLRDPTSRLSRLWAGA